jgi:hypothetical protein
MSITEWIFTEFDVGDGHTSSGVYWVLTGTTTCVFACGSKEVGNTHPGNCPDIYIRQILATVPEPLLCVYVFQQLFFIKF